MVGMYAYCTAVCEEEMGIWEWAGSTDFKVGLCCCGVIAKRVKGTNGDWAWSMLFGPLLLKWAVEYLRGMGCSSWNSTSSSGADTIIDIFDIGSRYPQTEYGLNQRVLMTRVSVQLHRDEKELAPEVMTSKLPIATGGGVGDQCIKFWNINTVPKFVPCFWNRHERELLSSHGFTDNQLTVWKYPSVTKISELFGHTSRVLHMAQSPDGYTAADERLRLWNVFGNPEENKPVLKRKVHKLPCGYLMQDMLNGYSKVFEMSSISPFRNLVEYVEVEEKGSILYACLMISGNASREFEGGKRSMMKVAQRMASSFCVSTSLSNGQQWNNISTLDEFEVRATLQKCTDSGHPNGVVISAASPIPPLHVFNFLRDERTRSQRDVLFNQNSIQEVAHIANDSHPGNSISVLRVPKVLKSSSLVPEKHANHIGQLT
ncbi:hypothetical protein CQW23_00671 [Capsicum baccatum]|uniref:HD-Zip IV C-terminal domain-containing protein n=1 Tax=Capsicum baccatum TaxID=33114 RepID=A0A2G2XLD6_CAPBA|nr:hypothetical protein CQW23_00671 [Capsicum baccatum]